MDKLKSCQAFLLLTILATGYFISISSYAKLENTLHHPLSQDYPIHSAIALIGDDSLLAFSNKSGNGTIQDPYIIANFTFSSGTVTNYIYLENITKYLHIVNCTFIGTAIAGIFLNMSRNIVLENLTFSGQTTAIQINQGNSIRAENLVLSDQDNGIHIINSSNILFYYAYITQSSNIGIWAENMHDSNFTAISIKDSGNRGLFWDFCNYNQFTLGNVENSTKEGLFLRYCLNNWITDNIISNNKKDGIRLATYNISRADSQVEVNPCENNWIVRNVIKNNGGFGVNDYQYSTNIFEGNTFENNGAGDSNIDVEKNRIGIDASFLIGVNILIASVISVIYFKKNLKMSK